MSEKKAKKGRRAYLNDFRQGADGKYVYTGAHYELRPGEKLPAFRRGLLLFSVLSAASAVARGCNPAGGMLNCFYVIIPYILEVGGVAFTVYAAFSFLLSAYPAREYSFLKTVRRVPSLAGFSAVCAGVGIFVQGIYLILRRGAGEPVPLILAGFLTEACGIAFALMLRRLCQKAEFIRTPGENEQI